MTQAENSRNSGPAFPTTTEHGFNCGEPGMTLRDYFAAKAMPACYAEYCAHANTHGYEEDWKMGVALGSYTMADAMLKARDHGAGGSENDRRVAACLDALKQRDELRDALKSCIDYGAMTGDDWVTDKALAALAKAGEPQ